MIIIGFLILLAIVLLIALIVVLLIPTKNETEIKKTSNEIIKQENKNYYNDLKPKVKGHDAENEYFKETNNSLFSIYFDKGINGEYACFKKLEDYQKIGARFLFNLVLPNGEKGTEIDLIMICQKGIIVIESKNRGGEIVGSGDERNWVQVLPGENINYFYNPLFQNRGHINAIRHLIGYDYDYYSIIVFKDDAEFKINYQKMRDEIIIHRKYLKDCIDEILDADDTANLSETKIAMIYNKLHRYKNNEFH